MALAVGRTRVAMHFPLGADADPKENHRTTGNRRAVGYALTRYWAGTLAARVNAGREGDAAVGLPIAGRFVTKMELGELVDRLSLEHSDLHIVLHEVYAYDRTCEDAARILGIAENSLRGRRDDGLHWLIERLWV